jgi:EmrB/QacA subfamily drug resistance transporter
MTLVATGLGLFMIFLDATIVNVALPDIQDDLGGGEGGLQWVVAAYTLTMGMFMMSSASLADRHGRRKLLILGMALFGGASALCGLAPSLPALAGSRALQGVGAAVVNVTSLALVSAAYPDKQAKAKAIGAWTGIAAVGLAIGPTLGGLLTEHVGWRSIFYLNVVVAAVGIVLLRAFVAESRDPADREADLRGQLLFIVGVGALTYGLIQGPQLGWASPEIIALLVGSLAVLVVFVLAELRAREPMMDVRLFRDRAYTAAIFTIFAVLFGVYGSFLVVTQYFQNVEGYSAEVTGLLMLANTLPTVVLSPVAGRLAARVGGRRPALVGVSCGVAGLCLLAFGPGVGLGMVLAGLFLLGCAAGLAIAPATNVAMSSVPEDRAGMASGIMSAQRALGSTAGYAIMGSVLAAVIALSLPGDLEAVIPDAAERQQVVDVIVADANPSAAIGVMGPGKVVPDDTRAYTDEVLAAADGAFRSGIRAAQLVAAGLALVALVVGYLLLPRREGAGPAASPGPRTPAPAD